MRRLLFLLSTLFFITNVSTQAQNSLAAYSLNQIATPLRGGVFGDFNGDGKLDYAVFCKDTNQVLTFIGRGDGFPAQMPPSTVSQLTCTSASIAVGDFNRDQKTDVVFIASAGAPITYAFGNGDGTFQTLQTIAFPPISAPGLYPPGNAKPVSVYTADFNHDGYTDLLVIDDIDDDVVYLANKSGGFSAPSITSPGFGSNFGSFTISGVEDVNHDGYPDVVITSNAGISVFLGKGDGTFSPGAGLAYTMNPSESSLLADLNGDGILVKLSIRAISFFCRRRDRRFPRSDNGPDSFPAGNTG